MQPTIEEHAPFCSRENSPGVDVQVSGSPRQHSPSSNMGTPADTNHSPRGNGGWMMETAHENAYKIMLFFIGLLPWVALRVLSFPWPLIYLAWEKIVNVRVIVAIVEDPNFGLWVSLSVLGNTIIFLAVMGPGPWFSVFVYIVTFTMASLYRFLLRKIHGNKSPEADLVDRNLLAAFGVYLIDRGQTSRWIYPVLSLGPAAISKIVLIWCHRDTYSVKCSKIASGKLVINSRQCSISDDVMFDMVPYVVSQSMLVYAALKTIAIFIENGPRGRWHPQ